MTNAVNPALAQPQGIKPKADRQGLDRQPDRSAFGEALQANRPGKRDAAEKALLQPGQRWLAPVKLAAAIGNAERSVMKQPPEILASVELDDMEEPDDAVPQSEGEPTDAAVFPPISVTGFHHPAFAARRMGDGNDAGPALSNGRKGYAGPNATAAKAEADAEKPVKNAATIDPAQPRTVDAAQDTAPKPIVLQNGGDTSSPKPEMAPAAAAELNAAAPRVAIMVEQSAALAPASTGVNLAEKLAAQATLILAPAKSEMPAQAAPPPAVQTHTLKLQLHPAELGIVTASLRFAGEQLTIELQVESAHAHQRLSADSDAIVKTLRGLGYEIDRVTILRPVIAQPAAARSDPDPSLGGQLRSDPQSLDAGGSNNGGDRLGRRDRGQGGEGASHEGSKNAGKPEDRTGGGLYI